jgi:hypothetical protein
VEAGASFGTGTGYRASFLHKVYLHDTVFRRGRRRMEVRTFSTADSLNRFPPVTEVTFKHWQSHANGESD